MVKLFVPTSLPNFDVTFQGELIHCNCTADVVAIKSANVILSTHIEDRYAAREIEGLAVVLGRYGRVQAAESLRKHNSKTRATEFLIGSVEYKRPMRTLTN